MLLEKKANIEAKDEKYGNTSLILASKEGHTDTAKTLIENKADLESKNKDGSTPLIMACYGGHTGTAKMLIENGANIEAKDNKFGGTLSFGRVE